MTQQSLFVKFTLCAAAALLFTSLAACSHGPSAGAKKALMACLAVTNLEATKTLGSKVDAMMLSGAGSPIHVCSYTDEKSGNTLALLQISTSKSKNPAADLAADKAQQKALFKNNVQPIQIHTADGFGPGAFYLDNTLNPTTTSVQLHLIDNGYRMMVQINNPKDFPSGEKQATAIAQQAFINIKNGSAFKTL